MAATSTQKKTLYLTSNDGQKSGSCETKLVYYKKELLRTQDDDESDDDYDNDDD